MHAPHVKKSDPIRSIVFKADHCQGEYENVHFHCVCVYITLKQEFKGSWPPTIASLV